MTTSGQRILTKVRIAPALVRASPLRTGAIVVMCCPCGQVCSPVLLRRLLLTQSNAFQLGNNPSPKWPFPWPRGSRSPSKTWSKTNGILIGSAGFAGFTVVYRRETDRQTDHATSVARARISVFRVSAMRCNNNLPTERQVKTPSSL